MHAALLFYVGGDCIKVITAQYPDTLDYLTLYPIADVHWGARECMETEFKAYLRRIAEDDHAAVILAGDLVNNGVKSSVTNVYEELYSPKEQKYAMADMLRPIAHKIIVGVSGNHEYRSAKDSDVDITEDIFRELGIASKYCAEMGFVKVTLGRNGHGNRNAYHICVTHGAGGGALLGSGVNRSDGFQMGVEGIDIMVSGHTHKPAKIPSARLIFDPYRNEVRRSNTLIFVCTSWLDYGGYPARGMMRPTAFAPDTIQLDGTRKEWK